jgi:hypothetical protein
MKCPPPKLTARTFLTKGANSRGHVVDEAHGAVVQRFAQGVDVEDVDLLPGELFEVRG